MPHAVWTGGLSFGLVNLPVRLVSAVSQDRISFRRLHEEDKQPIKQKRWCPKHDEEVPYEDIVRGYEIRPDEYVIVEDDELDNIKPERSKAIEIDRFVDATTIDPIFHNKSYYLVPDETAQKPYQLLVQALKDSQMAGLATFVMRRREHLVNIQTRGPALMLHTLAYADEVRTPDWALQDVQPLEADVTDKELETATQLIEALQGDFDPSQYKDTYLEEALELIRKKAEGETIQVTPAETEAPQAPEDLLDALQTSIETARNEG